jgi:hypothetical protein
MFKLTLETTKTVVASQDYFIKAVMDTVAANVDIPPLDKGALYVRPLLIGMRPYQTTLTMKQYFKQL